MRFFAISLSFVFGLLLLGSVIGMQESFVDSAYGITPNEFDTDKCNKIDEIWLSGNGGYTGCTKILWLDDNRYSWNDKVYISVMSPKHNLDDTVIEKITDGSVKISTGNFSIENYQLEESHPNSGLFTGEIILTGFEYDVDGDGFIDNMNHKTSPDGSGPNVYLQTSNFDQLVFLFELSDNVTLAEYAFIDWNVGKVEWLKEYYFDSQKSGIVRVFDSDMNLNSEKIDSINVQIFSDSDKGYTLELTENYETAGIFEGTVFFTTNESTDQKLRIKTNDVITVVYDDYTVPDPYTVIGISDTSSIDPIPPLGSVPRYNLRTIDSFGNSLDEFTVNQQVFISGDVVNGNLSNQPYVFIVQIKDDNNDIVLLDWSVGVLSPGQDNSVSIPWTPKDNGMYTATAYIWESFEHPIVLLHPIATTISVTEPEEELVREAYLKDDLIFENLFPVEIITKQVHNQTKIIPIEYNIKNGNITNISDNGNCSLFLDLDSSENGTLQIKIPREVIDSKIMGPPPITDNSFIVLFDGYTLENEIGLINPEIQTTSTHRILEFNFTNNVKVIKIVAFQQLGGTC